MNRAKFCTTLSLLTLGLSLCALPLQAQVAAVPPLMNFSGRLVTPAGNPVPDGTYSIRFSLWNDDSGGTEKWNQTISTVAVKNGAFSTLLVVNTAGLFNIDLWLEIKVGADAPLVPRQQIVSVAYAMKAQTVPDGSIGTIQIADGAITAAKLAQGLGGTGWGLTGNAGINPATNFLGTTDAQPIVFKTNGSERMRLLANGNFGIGTTAPAYPFTLQTPTYSYGMIHTDGVVSMGTFVGASNSGGSTGGWIGTVSSHPLYFFTGGSSQLMTLTTDGRLGIGTRTPGRALEVVGGVYANNSTSNGFEGYTSLAYNAGVYGAANNTLAWGVTGKHNATGNIGYLGASGAGVYGDAVNAQSYGVWGHANNTGGAVVGINDGNGTGVSGVSVGNGYGVYGRSQSVSGIGGYFKNSAGGLGLLVEGTASVGVLEIRGGADLAEKFAVTGTIEAGMVVEIDPDNEGKLRLSSGAFNRRVAGVISGAKNLSAGVVLTDPADTSKNSLPVAMSGRVWVYTDATECAVEPGDFMTTAEKAGYAMPVSEIARAQGAILGKAMTKLPKGKVGLVLVLVNLQ